MAAGYQHIFQGILGLRELSSKDKHHFPLFTITEVTSPEEGVEGAVFYLNITSQDTELVSPNSTLHRHALKSIGISQAGTGNPTSGILGCRCLS